MTYHVNITITDTDRPSFEAYGEGDVENLNFSFLPNSGVSFDWAVFKRAPVNFAKGGAVFPNPDSFPGL